MYNSAFLRRDIHPIFEYKRFSCRTEYLSHFDHLNPFLAESSLVLLIFSITALWESACLVKICPKMAISSYPSALTSPDSHLGFASDRQVAETITANVVNEDMVYGAKHAFTSKMFIRDPFMLYDSSKSKTTSLYPTLSLFKGCMKQDLIVPIPSTLNNDGIPFRHTFFRLFPSSYLIMRRNFAGYR